jgi:branched-chain amino acid aminotransferase
MRAVQTPALLTTPGEPTVTLPIHAYFKGNIVPYSEAKIGVMTHALNYGTAIFGGIRAYWNDDKEQLYVFRPLDHFKRLIDSTKIMCMEVRATPQELTQISLDLLRADGYRKDIYIRPLVYKSDETIGVRLHGLEDEITMFAIPFDRYVANDTDAHVTFSSWRRIDDNMIPARGKISGAYVNSALIKTDALRAGFDEALVLTQDGHVSEGSAENIFMLRGGEVITPPLTDNILEGITRRTLIELVEKEIGLRVIERPIDRTEIYLCDEFFMTGTAAQVTAVTQVDYRPIGTGEMGDVTRRLRDLFQEIVRGRNEKYTHWILPVYMPESQAMLT